MNIHKLFLSNGNNICRKWIHYFDIYEKHFSKFVNKEVKVLEIGVAQGGSVSLWKNYFGEKSTIVGIDIDKSCIAFNDTQNSIHIEIGSQNDTEFLKSIIDKYGTFDIIIDDGSHVMGDIKISFEFLYNYVNDGGVYLVEDLHTCYMSSYHDGVIGFIEYSKTLLDQLSQPSVNEITRANNPVTPFCMNTQCVSFYDSIVVFDKKRQAKRIGLATGFMQFT
jgi:hypothetical protein